MPKIALSNSDRQFLSLVGEAAFANPFSPGRVEIDRQILGGAAQGGWQEILPRVISEISSRIAVFDADGPARLSDFDPADRQSMEYVFLFDIFHRHGRAFDDHIADQIAAGPDPLPVPFAPLALRQMAQRGFEPDRALRFFALFFQIRRAWHFIDRGLIGSSPSMQQLRMNLWNNIFTHDIRHYDQALWDRMEDFSTLLLGPTGSGKGAAAAAIGRSGYIPFDPKKNAFAKSFTATFISINLSQFAETLLESELFGHTKGAFTGAVGAHEGLLSLCGPHGSVFLDEIGDISTAVQIKLLKVLEERSFSPVGSHKPIRFQGRVIAATNHDLDALRREGRFRDDFYYRLCSDCIRVPALRQRIQEDPAELDDLIAHSIRWITGADAPQLAATVREVVGRRLGPDYPWPGNVRELAQCIRRIIIKRDYEGDLAPLAADPAAQLAQDIHSAALTADQLLARYCALLYTRFGTYEEVARRTRLDRRTAKKHIQNAQNECPTP